MENQSDACAPSTLAARRRSVSNNRFFQAGARVAAAIEFQNHPNTARDYIMDQHLKEETIDQIDKDMPRTRSEDPYVKTRLGILRALLLRYAAEDAELGYCQGMNFVAALFAASAPSQNLAYERFKAFTLKLRGLWLNGFPLLFSGQVAFEELSRSKPWFQHFQRCEVDPMMYLPQAWQMLFMSWLPIPNLLDCMHLLERVHFPAILALTVARLDLVQGELLQKADMGEILMFLKDLHHLPVDQKAILKCTRTLLRSARDLTKASQQRANPHGRVGACAYAFWRPRPVESSSLREPPAPSLVRVGSRATSKDTGEPALDNSPMQEIWDDWVSDRLLHEDWMTGLARMVDHLSSWM